MFFLKNLRDESLFQMNLTRLELEVLRFFERILPSATFHLVIEKLLVQNEIFQLIPFLIQTDIDDMGSTNEYIGGAKLHSAGGRKQVWRASNVDWLLYYSVWDDLGLLCQTNNQTQKATSSL